MKRKSKTPPQQPPTNEGEKGQMATAALDALADAIWNRIESRVDSAIDEAINNLSIDTSVYR